MHRLRRRGQYRRPRTRMGARPNSTCRCAAPSLSLSLSPSLFPVAGLSCALSRADHGACARQLASEWLNRDSKLETVEKGRAAAYDLNTFRNQEVGKGWQASYVVRQKGPGGSDGAEKVIDMSSQAAYEGTKVRPRSGRPLRPCLRLAAGSHGRALCLAARQAAGEERQPRLDARL